MPRTSASFSPNPALRMASGQAVAGSSSFPALGSAFSRQSGGSASAKLQGVAHLVDVLDRYLHLPSTPQAFMFYLAGLILVFTGALLHVMVSAQVMAARIELAALHNEFALIEQQNGDLTFQISRHTNVMRLHEQAVVLGFVPATERDYVFVSAGPPLAAGTDAAPDTTPISPPAVVSVPLLAQSSPVIPDETAATRGTQAPWRAWTELLGLPARADFGSYRASPEIGDTLRFDLPDTLSEQLERFGLR